MTKERLLSFAEYAKDAQPEVLVTLIQTIVERIYIVDKDDERYCHIFIKGCSGEDYTGFFQTAGYIEQKTTPVCDSEQYCICYVLFFMANGSNFDRNPLRGVQLRFGWGAFLILVGAVLCQRKRSAFMK